MDPRKIRSAATALHRIIRGEKITLIEIALIFSEKIKTRKKKSPFYRLKIDSLVEIINYLASHKRVEFSSIMHGLAGAEFYTEFQVSK